MAQKRFPFFFLLCTLALALAGCHGIPKSPLSRSGIYLDTLITITLYGTEDEALLDHCFSLCASYEKLFSRTLEGSDVYRINHSQGQPTQVEEETALLIEKALYYSELTDGAFDCTVAPLSILWDFPHASSPPNSQEIRQALALVDYHMVQVTGQTVTLQNPNAAIDLGGIAKGYIADRIKDYLKSQGIASALIDLGGNILAVGDKPDGSAWNIGIQKPFGQADSAITSLRVHDQSLVTSGVYERYFQENGVLYHHLLDPSTGYPADTGLYSVTILTAHSVDADALSTACFVLGPEKGMALIESLPETEALFVTDSEELLYSEGLSPS